MEKKKFIRKVISQLRENKLTFLISLNVIVFFYLREKSWSKLAN